VRAAAAGLRQQTKALHVTVDKLLGSNSELADKVNAQAAQLAGLQAQVARAPAAAVAAPLQGGAGAALPMVSSFLVQLFLGGAVSVALLLVCAG
jgi:hypothetical protein